MAKDASKGAGWLSKLIHPEPGTPRGGQTLDGGRLGSRKGGGSSGGKGKGK